MHADGPVDLNKVLQFGFIWLCAGTYVLIFTSCVCCHIGSNGLLSLITSSHYVQYRLGMVESAESACDQSALDALALQWPRYTLTRRRFCVQDLPRLHLHQLPRRVGQTLFFPVLKPRAELLDEVWVSFRFPFLYEAKYVLETDFCIGPSLAQARPILPAKGSRNHRRSLHLNWPFEDEVTGEIKYYQAVVSRILAFTFHFRPGSWRYGAYDDRLVAHHEDHVHENNLLHNLAIQYRPEHSSEHRHKRPRV